MHPLYINDLITKTKEDLRFSTSNIRSGVDELKKGVGTFEEIQLEWFMKEIEVNAHLLQHSLHQLNKHTEKHGHSTDLRS